MGLGRKRSSRLNSLIGEQLSKTELKYSNVIKQQKSKIAQMEKIQTELTRKLEASLVDLADLKDKLDRVMESESNLTGRC